MACLLAALFVDSSKSMPAQQAAIPAQKPIQYEIAVTLKLIQVVVTDKEGNPVRHLEKSDFIVYDNGEEKKITAFEKHVFSAPGRPSEQPPVRSAAVSENKARKSGRQFFFFFDFAYNSQKGILKAKEAALHFLDSVPTPEDNVGIMTYSSLKGFLLNEFLSTDHKKIRNTVEKLDVGNIAGRAADVEEEYLRQGENAGQGDTASSSPFNNDPPLYNWKRQESKNMALNYIEKITALAKALRYVAGQKQILLFSSGIPSSLLQGKAVDKANSMSGAMVFDAGDPVLRQADIEMLKELNSANCSIYAFNTRVSETDLFAKDAAAYEERNKSVLAPPTVSDPYRVTQATGDSSLREISMQTGGEYFGNIHDYRKSMEEIQIQTGTYYTLGFPIGEKYDGRFHRIKVEVRVKGFEVRAQSGYYNPKPFREFSDLEKQLHLFDLALSEKPMLQDPIRFSLSSLSYFGGELTRLQIISKIPMTIIDRFPGKSVEIITLFFDDKGNLADLVRNRMDLVPYKGKDILYLAGTTLSPGPYSCRIVIRDLETGAGAVASGTAFIPDIARTGIRLQTPLLLTPGNRFAYLYAVSSKSGSVKSWNEIYPYDQISYSPVMDGIPGGSAKFFIVVPCLINGPIPANISYEVFLINSSSGARIRIPISILNSKQAGNVESAFLEVVVANVPAGKYVLYVYAKDVDLQSVSYAQTKITID